jgi:hypothetical protein
VQEEEINTPYQRYARIPILFGMFDFVPIFIAGCGSVMNHELHQSKTPASLACSAHPELFNKFGFSVTVVPNKYALDRGNDVGDHKPLHNSLRSFPQLAAVYSTFSISLKLLSSGLHLHSNIPLNHLISPLYYLSRCIHPPPAVFHSATSKNSIPLGY